MSNNLIPISNNSTIEVKVSRTKTHVVDITGVQVVNTFFGLGRRKKLIAAYEQEARHDRLGKESRHGKMHRRHLRRIITAEQEDDAQQLAVELIKQRIDNNAKLIKRSRMAALSLALLPTLGRGGFVMVEQGNLPKAMAEISRALPATWDSGDGFIQNMQAIGGNIVRAADAAGVDEAVEDLGKTASTIASGIYNMQPFGHADYYRVTPADTSMLGFDHFDEDLLADAAQAQAGTFIALPAGVDPLVQKYDALLRSDLATRQADGSVRYHARLADLRDLSRAVRADTAVLTGDEPDQALNHTPWLLAAAHIVYEGTRNGLADRVTTERRLQALGASYLAQQQLSRPGVYNADNDPFLQMIEAAYVVAIDTGSEIGIEKEDTSERVATETSLADSAVIKLAEAILKRAQTPDFGFQDGSRFGTGIEQQAFAMIADDPAMMRAFFANPMIDLHSVAADALMDVMAQMQPAERIELLTTYSNLGGTQLASLQQIRADAALARQPDQQLASLASSAWAGVTSIFGGEEPVVVAEAAPPTISRAAQSLAVIASIGAIGEVRVGDAFVAALRSRSDQLDLDALVSIAAGGDPRALQSAVLAATIERNGLPPNAAEMDRVSAELIREIVENVLVSEDHGALVQLLSIGNRFDDYDANGLVQNFTNVVDAAGTLSYATNVNTVEGYLAGRMKSLYNIDARMLHGLITYTAANESNFNPFNPPILDDSGNGARIRALNGCLPDWNLQRDRYDYRCWAAPVFGWYHFTPDTTATGASQAYIPLIMNGEPGQRFVDRFQSTFFSGAGEWLASRDTTQQPLTQHEVTQIILDAAFGPAYYRFDNATSTLFIKRSESEREVAYALGTEDGVMNFTRTVRSSISQRLERNRFENEHLKGLPAIANRRHESTRMAFVPLERFFREGGNVTTMRGRDMPLTDLSLARFVGLNYDLQTATHILVGNYVANRPDLGGLINSDTPAYIGAAHAHGMHVFGGEHVDGVVTNDWENVRGATRNPFMTRQGSPRYALAERGDAIATVADDVFTLRTLERTLPRTEGAPRFSVTATAGALDRLLNPGQPTVTLVYREPTVAEQTLTP